MCGIVGIVDFRQPIDAATLIALRDTLKRIVDEWDHHMLLPTQHPTIHVVADELSVEVTHADRRWVFPRPQHR